MSTADDKPILMERFLENWVPLVATSISRPRNAVATRQAILDAARERFTAQSYEDVGMRDVARDVGVDAALVSRYFGSKEDLFVEVLDSCKNGRDLMDRQRDDFGRRVSREVVFGEYDDGSDDCNANRLGGLLILLRSIGSAKAMDVVQKTSNARFFDPLTEWIGGDDAAVRARLVAGLIMGMAISRELTNGFSSMPRAEQEALAKRMATALQGLLDG